MSTHPLPTDFVTAITAQLGADTDGFLASYADPPTHGLRVNPAKVSLERLRELTGWVLEQVPWCPTGAYIDPGVRAGAHPYHAAGLYYLQEPSAMVVAEMADLAPGQTVLDLAAAPGGKSTQIASAIGPRGLLIANEIHAGRIKALGENLERWGAVNVVVTNSSPDKLAGIGPVFDRVIVDAPCSGEGLFRREPDARREWSRARVSGSADRQRDILDAATGLIGPGGELVYSTCTFNQTENEGVVAAVLAGNGDWHVGERRRLWPHLVRGEGHVVHRLGRAGSEPSGIPERRDRADDRAARLAWDAFSHEHFSSDPIAHLPGKLEWRDHRLMLATGHELDLSRIAVVRDGLWLGERKPGRFEPSHALALAIDPALATNRLDLEVEAARRWIGGEPVTAAGPAGWVLITVDGFGLGWGKRSASIVKNHYPKGLRRVSREA